MWNIWRSELMLTFRQRTYYSFVILWVVILGFLFLLQGTSPAFSGYTNITGTIMNLLLYIIPLFMLINGSFSIANEMENGQFRLLSTYPLSSISYVIGKVGGQFTSQLLIFTLSYGISLMIGLICGIPFSMKWMLALYFFAVGLIFFFLLMGIVIGSFTSTRWKALSISVFVWFFLIMLWPTALISVLNHIPYQMIGLVLKSLLFVNPAELIRFIFVIQLNGGSIFGQAYDSLVSFYEHWLSWAVLFYYTVVVLFISIVVSDTNLTMRRRK
ncbi:ABC transporter permease [Bacillus smithii]|uniref:ABC transporter permease n=1 Tax=Bacillus smithii TaxID=1479 RepID=UPI0030C8E6DB